VVISRQKIERLAQEPPLTWFPGWLLENAGLSSADHFLSCMEEG
jgi:hypothetical protein